jgi:UDP-glucose 4-epimerase
MSRVLVTGAGGFIGSAVEAALAEQGHELVEFDYPRDVLHRSDVFDAVRSCDAVIHLAGVLGTSELLGHEQHAVDVNITGALNVFEAADDRPVVQIGTGHRGQLNTYAVTKACAEDLALTRAGQGRPVNVVRAFHAYGPGQKPPAPHGHATVRKIIPSFVCRALTGMPVEIWGDGKQVIDLVHVDDVARALVAGLEGPYGRVIEAGTGVGTTVLDAAQLVIETCGSFSDIVHLPMRPGEPEGTTVVAADPFPYRYGLAAGLEQTIPWYRDLLA